MMIKKIYHIIVMLLLLVATSGMAVSSHYCKGELVSVTLNTEQDSCCDMPGETKGCCDFSFDFFKVDDDFVTTTSYFSPIQFSLIAIISDAFNISKLAPAQRKNFISNYNLPPPKKQNPLSLIQSFLL